MAKARIQEINIDSRMGADSQKYLFGHTESFIVDASNSFYTTQVTGLSISATTYTAPTASNTVNGTMVVTFSGSPNLSEVMVGNYLHIQECEDAANIGRHEITAVNDGADTITIKIRDGVTNATSSGTAKTLPFFGAYYAICLEDTSGLSINANDQSGGSYGELTTGITLDTEITQCTISTSGKVELKLI